MLPLPVPQRGGSIEALAAFLNLLAPDEFMLVAVGHSTAGRPLSIASARARVGKDHAHENPACADRSQRGSNTSASPPGSSRRASQPKPINCLPAANGCTKSSTTDFRIIARKDGDRVRPYSRPGNDMTRRFPRIVEALARLRSRSCIIDGEAVACDDNGVALFDLIRHATTTVSSSCVPPRRRDAFISRANSRVCSESVVRADS
jgi:ATP dependent DNA ligase domain